MLTEWQTDLERTTDLQCGECKLFEPCTFSDSRLTITSSPSQCQTAAALAEADEKGTMQISRLEAIANATLESDRYLEEVYGGDDAERVRCAGERADAFTFYDRAPNTYQNDDRYRDYYQDRDYRNDARDAPRRMSRDPRSYLDDRVHDRYSGRGGDRDDARYVDRQRSSAVEPREHPRVVRD
jgi:hypothetical protein